MVPAVCPWHDHHTQAERESSTRLERGERLVLAAPALVDAYSVLTRLPGPFRLRPEAAQQVLFDAFVHQAEIVALGGHDYVRLIEDAARGSTSGGQIYDAVIAACAQLGGVNTLLTFNDRHFLQFESSELRIKVPEST